MNRPMTIDDFVIGIKLGDGQCGKVYLAKEKHINQDFALKILSSKTFDRKNAEELINSEIKIHYALHHENILKLFGYFSDPKGIYIVLEYCNRGEMYKDILKCKGYSNERCATYIYQLANALHFCHKNNIIHRDIKSENILLTDSGALKLADFGCSKKLNKNKRNTLCGTLVYLSPEVLSGANQTAKVDIWCLGVLLFEMLSTKNPFYNDSVAITRENIITVKYEMPRNLHVFAEALLYNTLHKDPMTRLSAKQIITFPFVNRYAEKSLSNCSAAVQQWTEMENLPNERLDMLSFEASCPTIHFSNDNANNDIDIHNIEIGSSSLSLLHNCTD